MNETEACRIKKYISAKMKSCPFCGNEASLYGTKTGGLKAACSIEDCGASLPSWVSFEEDEDALEKIGLIIDYWNKRTNL